MHFNQLGVGSATVAAGFPCGERPKFPMGKKSHWDNKVYKIQKKNVYIYKGTKASKYSKCIVFFFNTVEMRDYIVAFDGRLTSIYDFDRFSVTEE